MTNRTSRSSTGARSGGSRSRRGRVARRPHPKRTLKTILSLSLFGILSVIALGMLAFLVVFWKFSSELPNIEAATADIKTPVPTTIWSNDGVLLGQLTVENRQPIDLDKVPKDLIDATIAIEDHRFWEHPGIDVQGIGRAVFANLRGNSMRQGASTLTQQLVRQPSLAGLLGLSTEKKLSRKIREALVALRVEQIYSKKEILALYLNNVYYGAGAYGVQAASLTYFGKSAYKLTLSEAALLAGLPQRPNSYMPFDHLRAALKRRDEVLTAMQTYRYITPQQYNDALAERPTLSYRPDHHNSDFKAPYFTTYVLDLLKKKYGADLLYHGLKVETTLNWKMQQEAEKALEQGIEHAGRQANQGAVVCLDNQSGYIRALVGGRNYQASKFNAVTQGRRQPGSTFKAFVYSAAFETGQYTLDSTFPDVYFAYPGDPQHRGVDGESDKTVDILTAVKYSYNSVAVQVAYKIGIKKVIDYAHRMGITTKLDPYLPTAIGATAVRPLDLCSAYSLFPMGGRHCVPMAVVRVTDADGNVLDEYTPGWQIQHTTDANGSPVDTPQILKPSTVDMMNKAFEAVVEGGTGTAAKGDEKTGVIADARGKTGTTNDGRDVWFAGYTPKLTAVIWVASVVRKGNRYQYRGMPGAFGGLVCAPIWHDFMIKAVDEEKNFKVAVQEDAPDATRPPQPVHEPDVPRPRRRRHKPTPAVTEPPVDSGDGGPTPDNGSGMPGSDGGDTAPTTADPKPDPDDMTPAPPTNPAPHDTDPAPNADDQTQTAPPARLHAVAPPVRSSEQPMKSVRVCVESGDLATPWCTETETRRVPAAQAARMHRCRIHHPPPGEQ